MQNDVFKTSKNTPAHLFRPNAVYFLTGAIYNRVFLMHAPVRKKDWIETFQHAAGIYNWQIIAWVVLSNHYHVLVVSPDNALNLSKFVGSYHKFTARKWNEEDRTPGRKVWWNYWDYCIKSERDFLAHLNYIHQNPVKHGLVKRAEDYPFSSYCEFLSVDATYPESELSHVLEF